jgi:GT2 family glycosyltransferase
MTSVKGLISVIIVNFNGERFIGDCIKSVLDTNYASLEVIVVDNHSTDESLKILGKFRNDPRVETILLRKNLHYAGGNNVGIRNSKGEYLLILNNDTIMEHDCLKELVARFESDRDISAVQCLLAKMGENGLDSIGGTIDYCGRLMPVSFLWLRNSKAKKQKRIFWGGGAALGVRRSVLENVGHFDLEVPTDEVDLCWRINLAGGKIVLEPKAIVNHFGSGSFGKELKKERLFLGELARLSSVTKNYEVGNLLKYAPYMASYLIITLGWDVFFRNRADFASFRLRAYVRVLKDLRRIFRKRSTVQKYIRKVKDSELRKLMIRPNPYYYLYY